VIYLKAIVVGVVVGLSSGIAWILAGLFLSLLVSAGEGVGAVSVMVETGPAMLAASIGFMAGFWWQVRRGRRQRAVARD
jgi:hypothetical protein